LFYSFGEMVYGIGLKHANANGTTCGRPAAETLSKIYFWSIL